MEETSRFGYDCKIMDKYLSIGPLLNSPLLTYKSACESVGFNSDATYTVASADRISVTFTAVPTPFVPGAVLMRTGSSDAAVMPFVASGRDPFNVNRILLAAPFEHDSLIPVAGSTVRVMPGPLVDCLIYNEMPSTVSGDFPALTLPPEEWPYIVCVDLGTSRGSKVVNTAFSAVFETEYDFTMHILAPFYASIYDIDVSDSATEISDALARQTLVSMSGLSALTQQVRFLFSRKTAFANSGQTPKFLEGRVEMQYNQRVPIPGLPEQVAYAGNSLSSTLLLRDRRNG